MRRIALFLSVFLVGASLAQAGSVVGKVTVQGTVTPPLVVYVEEIAGAKAAPLSDIKIHQLGMEFFPPALVVTVGTSVDFPNVDKIYHNVFSPTAGNRFDLGLYRGGVAKSTVMNAPGEVEIYCNIHPKMWARILVLQNDRFAQVADDGSYRIADVPLGTRKLVAWAASHKPVGRPLTVTDGEVKIDFDLAEQRPAVAHLNKSGEQYGRYK